MEMNVLHTFEIRKVPFIELELKQMPKRNINNDDRRARADGLWFCTVDLTICVLLSMTVSTCTTYAVCV